jgi:hypothetical protein
MCAFVLLPLFVPLPQGEHPFSMATIRVAAGLQAPSYAAARPAISRHPSSTSARS